MKIQCKSLSFSTVQQFISCPQAFWYDKILRKKPVGKPANLIFGSALHECAEVLYRHWKAFNKPAPQELLERIFWHSYEKTPEEDVIYTETQSKDDLFHTAGQLLGLLVNEPGLEVLEVETAKVLDLDGLKVPCRIDLVTRGEDGIPVIWDLKTAARKYGEDELLKVGFQLGLYSLAFNPPFKLKTKVLLKQRTAKIENIDIPGSFEIVEEVIDNIKAVKHAIEAQVHYRIRSFKCAGCGWKYLCDKKPETEEDDKWKATAAPAAAVPN